MSARFARRRGEHRCHAVGEGPVNGPTGRRWLPMALLALAFGASLGACRPLYVPLVPDDAPQPVARTRLAAESELRLVAGRPLLRLVVADIAPESRDGDWLAVQWFGPSGRLEASESQWLDASSEGAALSFELPADVTVMPGEWRAVASLGGFVLRQFRVDVATDPEP